MYRYRLFLRRHPRIIRSLIILIILVLVGLGIYVVEQLTQTRVHDFNSCIAAGYDATGDDPQTCSDGKTTYPGPLAPDTKVEQPSGVPQDYSILVTADSPGVWKHDEQVIQTQADWAAYWAKIHTGIKPTPPLLPVDFTQQSVIAIIMGQQNTAGYGLEFSGIIVGEDSATVSYTAYQPGQTCKANPKLTNPYLLIATKKLTVPVTYTMATKNRSC